MEMPLKSPLLIYLINSLNHNKMNDLDTIYPKIESDVKTICSQFAGFKVTDAETNGVAAKTLGEIKARLKRIDELRKQFTQPLNDQVKKINNMFKLQSEPLEAVEASIKSAIKLYMDEEDRKARIEAERIRKEQEAKEKAERDARMEAERAEREKQRLEAEAAKAKDAEKRALLEKQAAKARAEAEAKKKEAEQALHDAQALAPVEAPQKSVRTESGLVTRKLVWTWKVTDEALLRKTHPEFFIVDVKALNKFVSEGGRTIAGLEVYQESEISAKPSI